MGSDGLTAYDLRRIQTVSRKKLCHQFLLRNRILEPGAVGKLRIHPVDGQGNVAGLLGAEHPLRGILGTKPVEPVLQLIGV